MTTNRSFLRAESKKDRINAGMDVPLFLICLVVILIPLSFLLKGMDFVSGEEYTYRLGSYVLFYEAIILVAIPYTVFQVFSGQLHFKLMRLDILLACFLFFLLIPIVLSWDIMYVALREYRHAYFVPFIFYLLFKLCVRSKQQLNTVLKAFIIPAVIQAIFVVLYFIQHGSRVDNAQFVLLKVVLSVVLALGFAIIVFLPWNKKSSFRRLLKYMLGMFLLLAIILSAGRMAIFSVIAGFILIRFFITKGSFQVIYKSILPIMVVLMFLLSATMSAGDIHSTAESTKEDRYSIARVLSAEQFKESAMNRIALWDAVITLGMESPIYGLGLKFYEKYNLGAAHTHNVYLNIFASAGIIGIVFFIYIFIYTFNSIFHVLNNHSDELTASLAKSAFFFGMIMMLSGASNAYEGGLQPILFLYFTVVAKLAELHVETDTSEIRIDNSHSVKKFEASRVSLRSK